MTSMLGDLKKRLGGQASVAAHPLPAATTDEEESQAGGAVTRNAPETDTPAHDRWPEPPSPKEIAAYLGESGGYVPAEQDDVMIAEEAGVFLALEGGAIVANACVVVRGWLVDEAEKVIALYLHIDGELRLLHRSAYILRPDVNAYVKPRQPGYKGGLSAIEPFDGAPEGPLTARLVAIVHEAGEFRPLISAREIAVSQSHHVDRVADELSTYWCSPTEMARLARPYLRRVADAVRGFAWPDRQPEVIGSGECDATLILVIDRNIDMLEQLLAFLEMRPNHRRLGLVIVFSRPEHAERGVAVTRRMRSSSGFAFIRLLNPVHPVTFAAAVRRALQVAEGEAVIVCTDSVLPPAEAWIERLVELSRRYPKSLLAPSVTTFDGRPGNLAGLVDELPLDRFDWDHARTLEEIAAGMERLGSLGVGVVAARRAFLTGAEVFDDSYTQMPFTFADAFHRLGGAGSDGVRHMDMVFTALILPEHYVANPSEVLWNAYALHAVLGERPPEPETDTAAGQGAETERADEPRSAAEPAPEPTPFA